MRVLILTSPNMRGDDVKEFQTKVVAAGFSPGSIDGIYGPNSEKACKNFQRARGLTVDGKCGPNTWAALNSQPSGEPRTAHFKLSEFACKDGTPVPQKYWGNVRALMNELEIIRAIWGKPITIRSGYRTQSWNKKQGGAAGSYHLTALAADIEVAGVSPAAVYAELDKRYANQGVGKYPSFTHIDLRGHRARW